MSRNPKKINVSKLKRLKIVRQIQLADDRKRQKKIKYEALKKKHSQCPSNILKMESQNKQIHEHKTRHRFTPKQG